MSGIDWTGADWTGLGLGAVLGLAVSALYFAGLAWGIRIALRRARSTALLLASAALRIALLLAAGWWVAGQGAWPLAGFVLAFVAARVVILAAARRLPERETAPWN